MPETTLDHAGLDKEPPSFLSLHIQRAVPDNDTNTSTPAQQLQSLGSPSQSGMPSQAQLPSQHWQPSTQDVQPTQASQAPWDAPVDSFQEPEALPLQASPLSLPSERTDRVLTLSFLHPVAGLPNATILAVKRMPWLQSCRVPLSGCLVILKTIPRWASTAGCHTGSQQAVG